MIDFPAFNFSPVMNYPDPCGLKVFDFSDGYDPEYVQSFEWGIGKYDEKRRNMYTAPQYKNSRNIHMGLDIYAEAGAPVFSFYEGTVCYKADNNQPGNYGPTLVLRYLLSGQLLFALYGHLSRESLSNVSTGETVDKGQEMASVGPEEVNGGWTPHLHFQLSWDDPGKADMPGVVSDENHESALKTYPNPQLVTGLLY